MTKDPITIKNKVKNKDENKGTPDTRYDKGIRGYKACKL